MSDPISGIASAAGDVASAGIQASAEQNTAKQEEQAAEQLAQQNFQEQTNYVGNQEQAYRDALTGVAQQGNPYATVPQSMAAPTYTAGGQGGTGTFGGGTFANGSATPTNGATAAGLTGAQATPSVAAGTAKAPQPVARVGSGVTNY